MPNDVEVIKKFESELWGIVQAMHKGGIRYTVIYSILQEMVKTLEVQGYAEQWIEGTTY